MKAVHLEARRALRALGLIAIVATGARAASLNGNAFALRSTGRSSGTSWILDRNGYVGTYITLSAPGTVKVDVSADGTSSPNMNIVIDDTKAAFTVSQTKKTYSYSYSLPAGTHFVRTELSNDRSVSNRQLKINSFNVTGANISNTNTNANALAASDTYIANYRKGNARVTIPGVAPGRQVNVSLKKLNFTLGASVDWNMDPLLTENSTAAANFRSILNKNFNTVATDNEMWKATESERGEVTMDQANRLFAYAQQNGLATRMHNMIWEQVQPDWVESLKSRAGRGSASAKSELRQAISDRIDYYVGDGTAPDLATQYAELDVYNESYHAGQLGGRNTYWNIYGASGIASIFNETKQAIQAAGANTKLFVNDYDVLDDPNYMNGYTTHIDALRQAAANAGYGEIVDAIGMQYYKDTLSAHQASRFFANLQNANVQGLPTQLSEFGAFTSLSQTNAAKILDESLRLMFGNPTSVGFLNWYWVKEDNGADQFAPNAALYTVNTSNWGNMTITPAGKIWQDRLGIQDWDGNSNNAWTTQLTATVGPDGTISFNGYYGDYVLTINGQTYNLSLRKGTTDYALALIGGSPVPEPSSLVLLVMSLGCSLRWRRSSPAAA